MGGVFAIVEGWNAGKTAQSAGNQQGAVWLNGGGWTASATGPPPFLYTSTPRPPIDEDRRRDPRTAHLQPVPAAGRPGSGMDRPSAADLRHGLRLGVPEPDPLSRLFGKPLRDQGSVPAQ